MLFGSISITRKFALKRFSRRSLSSSGSGDIRGAGGTFGKKEKAQEEQYFRQKEKEELAQFKKKLEEKDPKKAKDSESSNKKK